jgi:hypothetical protein
MSVRSEPRIKSVLHRCRSAACDQVIIPEAPMEWGNKKQNRYPARLAAGQFSSLNSEDSAIDAPTPSKYTSFLTVNHHLSRMTAVHHSAMLIRGDCLSEDM